MIFSPASYSFKETIKKYRVKDKIPKHKKKDTIKETKNSREKEEIILKKIKENPSVTAEELAKILNINLRNTKKYLAKLKETKKIKRLGSRKNGIWQVVEGK